MRTLKSLAMAVVLFANVLGVIGSAAAAAPKAASTPKSETLSVIRIVGVDEEIRVVQSSAVADLKKTIADEDKAAEQQYNDDKKAAGKNKDKFDQPKPVKRKVTVLKSGLKTADEAQDWIDKHPTDSKTGKK
jgi:FKBP-type peptidyl-prolyl cis-trans isomerase